jgi:phenylpropionate dioxygenase-like ring-hydroxylating dioxygenase large terminal subunit
MLFVYPGNPENALSTALPIVDPLEESPSEWIIINTFRDLPYDALTLLENVLDSSHIPYTHHGSVGNRAYVSPVELSVTESGKNGFKGVWQEGPRKGKLGTQYTTFVAPGLMWHDLTSKQFGRTLTVVYATPIRKGECRLFALFPFKFSAKLPGIFLKLTPRWYSHLNQNAILEDDQIFLHYQERYLEAAGGSENFTLAFYLPTKADSYVFTLRQWVNQYSLDPFLGQKFSPPLPTEELLDRYRSHTIHCKSCSKAFVNLQKIRLASGLVSVILLAATPLELVYLHSHLALIVTLSVIVSLISGIKWLAWGDFLKKFTQGQTIAPRNLPEKLSN